ncbi:MAG TPA: hypothetical protein VLT90_01130 [Terriglobales bacterium]|nr:hypothetical protein [Terriglobales bacterium]
MKLSILPALFLTLLAIVFGTIPSIAQEAASTSADSSDAGLPSAPSAAHGTTCTERNGKPCPEWVHKWIGQYPHLPQSEPLLERDPSTVHLWTYRRLGEPALRTNKEVFHSKVFITAHVGGAIAMAVACRNKNSGYSWGEQVPAVSALFAIDYLQFRFVGAPNAIAPPVYEMIKYGRASTK